MKPWRLQKSKCIWKSLFKGKRSGSEREVLYDSFHEWNLLKEKSQNQKRDY